MYLYTDRRLYAYAHTSTNYLIIPSGKITDKKETASIINLYSREKFAVDYQLYVPVLATGRGFGAHINRITNLAHQENGVLVLEAEGTFPNPTLLECKWELTLSEDDYLVRRAVASSWHNGRPFKTIETTGVLGFSGGTVARAAAVAEVDSSMWQGDAYVQISFESVESGSDSKLLQDAKSAVSPPYETGAQITDERGDRIVTYTVGVELQSATNSMLSTLDIAGTVGDKGVEATDGRPKVAPSDRSTSTLPLERSGLDLYVWVAVAMLCSIIGFLFWHRMRRRDNLGDVNRHETKKR
jgi:hypothetical protein